MPGTREKTRAEMLADLMAAKVNMMRMVTLRKGTDEEIRSEMEKKGLPLTRDKTPERRAKTHEELIKEIDSNPNERTSLKEEAKASYEGAKRVAQQRGIPLERDVSPAKAPAPNPHEKAAEAKKFSEQRSTSRQRARTPVAAEIPVGKRIDELEKNVKAQARSETPKKKATFAEPPSMKPHGNAPLPGKPESRFTMPNVPDPIQSFRNTMADVTGNPAAATEPLTEVLPTYQETLRSKSPSRLRSDLPMPEAPSALPAGMAEQILESERRRAAKMAENAARPPEKRTFDSPESWNKLVAEKALEEYNRPIASLEGEDIVTGLQPRELSAREMLDAQNPFSEEHEKQLSALKRQIDPYITDRLSLDSANPYLKRMSESPAAMHKDLFGDVEREHFKSIRDEGAQHFNESILPGIRNKYQVPGLRQHGHMGHDINRAVEKFAKGQESALAQQKGVFRGMSLDAAQKYAQQQGTAAHIASGAANKDRENNLDAISMAEAVKKNNDIAKTQHRGYERELGHEDRAMAEAQKLATIENFYKKERRPEEKLASLSNVVRGHPVQSPGAYTAPKIPESNAGATSMNMAQMMMGGAGAMLPNAQKRAKGGRVHKAYGGIVDPTETAIQNAVVQKSDPIYELRRLMNLPDPVQQYAVGGQVSPIEAGAQEAKQYAGHTAMQNRLARMRDIPEEPMLNKVIEGMMRGGSYGTGWMANGAKAFTDTRSAIKTGEKENHERRNAADELEYKLQQDITDRALKERDMARQEKLAEAQMRHFSAQNAHLGLQGKKLEYDIQGGFGPDGKPLDQRPTGKQTVNDVKTVNNSEMAVKANVAADRAMEYANTLAQKLNTRPGKEAFAQSKFVPTYLADAVNSVVDSIANDENGKTMTIKEVEELRAATKAAVTEKIAAIKLENPGFAVREAEQKAQEAIKVGPGNTPKLNQHFREAFQRDTRAANINHIRKMISGKSEPYRIREALKEAGLTMDDVLGKSGVEDTTTPSKKPFNPSDPIDVELRRRGVL